MRLLLAIFLPWLQFFTIGRPFAGIICFLLQCTIIGWIPAAIWSVFALSQYKTDKKIESFIASQQNPAAEQSKAENQKNQFIRLAVVGGVFMLLPLCFKAWDYISHRDTAASVKAGLQHSTLISSPSISVAAANIDGNWQGTYESHGHTPTPFTMAINKPSNGLFDGSASEQIVSSGVAETIQSKLSGAINTMSVAFTKEFSFKGKQYSVQYIGTYDPITKRIQGTWKGSTGNTHGSFLVWR